MEPLLVIVLTGAAAGFLGGLFGIGGGLLIVPALAVIFARQAPGLAMHMAVATSLAVILPTAIASAWTHHRRGAVVWGDVTALAPMITAGVLIGVVIANQLSAGTLADLFGAYALVMAIQLAVDRHPASGGRPVRLPDLGRFNAAGLFIGTLSAILGIGGGTMVTPYLLWRGRPMHAAVGTSAACGVPIALIGCVAYIVAGWGKTPLPAWSTGYVYWPAALLMTTASTAAAPLGARQAHRLSDRTLKRIFAVLLLVIGVKMLFG